MRGNFFSVSVVPALLLSIGARAGEPGLSPTISEYKVELRPDFKAKTVSGRTTLFPASKSGSNGSFSFSIGSLEIDGVEVDGKKSSFKLADGKILIVANHAKELTVYYHGPSKGLTFGSNYVYTGFDTCTWMLCTLEPKDKADFELALIVPNDYSVVANGESVSKVPEEELLTRHIWREVRPYSTYLFGFAAGKFHEARVSAGKTNLRYLGVADDRSALLSKFKDTERMMRFFEEKAGTPFPGKIYTQVLVPDDEAQEKSSFSIIGKSSLDPILTKPQEDWVIAHELAHQWWGNLVTCKDWKDFWLNEGISVFLVAAYKERRWGHQAYLAELALAQKRYQKAIDANLDVPLTYEGKYPSIQLRRAIVYSKGALFMDTLRNAVGDKAFWKGLRIYTQENIGKSVESRTFQTAMEKAAEKKLSSFFDKWVY
jgi:aminopeptidase N